MDPDVTLPSAIRVCKMHKVTIINARVGTIQCDQCEHRWVVNIRPNSRGRWYYGWWKCPNGCNETKD